MANIIKIQTLSVKLLARHCTLIKPSTSYARAKSNIATENRKNCNTLMVDIKDKVSYCYFQRQKGHVIEKDTFCN